MKDLDGTEDRHIDEAATDRGFRVEWDRIVERARPVDVAPDDADDTLDAELDYQARPADSGSFSLLVGDEGLDRAREFVPVHELHPDRLTPATPEERIRLSESVASDDGSYAWIRDINPGMARDMIDGSAGRTENCADCARAVQSTLDGNPSPAGSIDPRGLPLAGQPEGSGESIEYTEQWAGRRAEQVSYAEIGRKLSETHGSAIVFVYGAGGHATNAVWDGRSEQVLWLDGQIGAVSGWPPTDLVRRFPRTCAIFFDNDHTTDRRIR